MIDDRFGGNSSDVHGIIQTFAKPWICQVGSIADQEDFVFMQECFSCSLWDRISTNINYPDVVPAGPPPTMMTSNGFIS